jgi:hypothetical protein
VTGKIKDSVPWIIAEAAQSALRTLNNALGPEAAAASGEGITETVLLIGFREITAAAKRAGRKLK